MEQTKVGTRECDARIFEVAARQHGVVGRRQLLGLGLTETQIDHRVTTGRLLPLHRGIYRAGPLAGPHAREMAAVLACGERAAVSHRSAAALWQLRPGLPPTQPVHVTVPRDLYRERPGIQLHRSSLLGRSEVARVAGVPVTGPARTLLDLATLEDARELERLLAEALERRLTTRRQIRTLLRGRRGRPGVRALLLVLEAGGEPALTRSQAEDLFLALIVRALLPKPEVNVRVEGLERDFLWRAQRLVVEIDGFAFHSSARRFEQDRSRDAALVAAGFRVLRFTWRQLVDEPEAVVARVAQALARGSFPG